MKIDPKGKVEKLIKKGKRYAKRLRLGDTTTYKPFIMSVVTIVEVSAKVGINPSITVCLAEVSPDIINGVVDYIQKMQESPHYEDILKHLDYIKEVLRDYLNQLPDV